MIAVPEVPLIKALLASPDCYGHPVYQVRLIETHISWVLLTGEYAYKIKKPVNLGFLDFSTLALRRQACDEEVRLNRRLAPAYYLGVVPITGRPDAPHLDGPGNPFEFAVRMRQFPPQNALDHMAQRGELGAAQIDRLAARLAHFHRHECAVASADMPWGEPEAIAKPVAENFELLEARLRDPAHRQLLAQLHGWSESEHRRLAPLMRERKRGGYIRECHGDLHLANLAWVDGELVIFDCIEFNPALRWIDIISEVAFCYMDLLHRGLDELAARFLNAWQEATGDYEGMALLRYYAVYRAMVRAKVAALRADQTAQDEEIRAELESCLRLAERLSQIGRPALWITHGLSGSGKTTVSQLLLQQHGMIRLRSDVERKRMAGLDALARSGGEVGAGLYTRERGEITYSRLAQLAETLLTAGWPVIVDAACLERGQRDLFRELAVRLKVEFRIVDVQVAPAILRERVVRRMQLGHDASEAGLQVLQHQLETSLPLDADERAEVVEGITGQFNGIL